MKIVVKISIGTIIVLFATIFLMYGTLSPCEILKKEISTKVQKQGDLEQGLYLLFGGFFERIVDGLTPIQCMQKLYEIKTRGHESVLSEII
jgi:hypothetical protein